VTVDVRRASSDDAAVVSAILHEAASWLDARGTPLWRADELDDQVVAAEVNAGLFWIAHVDQESAGVVRLQFSDPEFWPDVAERECLFLHRLAVRRSFAGGAVSSALLAFARDVARRERRRVLCLDCEASRTRLRAVYERFGFTHVDDRQVGPYYVSRYTLVVEDGAPG
jgi:GNAT superfamily N-acetyltransferase